MYKLIAFDFDGTIFETLAQCLAAFKKTLTPYMGHEPTNAEIEATFGLNEEGMVRQMVGDRWQEALKDFYAEYARMHEAITEPFDGIRELLCDLHARGAQLAMITGKGEVTCRISLEKLGMQDTFADVLCGEADAPNKDKRIAELLEKYGLKKDEIVYIGDSVKDVEACRRAGVRCLSAAWQDDARRETLEKINPGWVFGSVEEIGKHLVECIG